MKEPEAYTDPSQWSRTEDPIPPDVWAIIRDHYITPCSRLFYHHRVALVPSDRSCYRTVAYELSRGRRGSSLHTFPPGTLGACDLTTASGLEIIHHLDTIVDHGPWRRIAVYTNNNFIHVDYGDQGARSGDRRSLWACARPREPWRLMSYLPDPLRIDR